MEHRIEGKFSISTFTSHLGSWHNLPTRFIEFAVGKPAWADVLEILGNESTSSLKPARPQPNESNNEDTTSDSDFQDPHVQAAENSVSRTSPDEGAEDGPTYGPPINFRGLRHEPVNEQGVVLVFGMVAKELGYFVKAVQQGYPDCEAKREVDPGRWKRVRIEFEFESKNFAAHGHRPDGCDLIVCWRDNWMNRPNSLEVLELSSEIKKLPNR